LYAWVVPLDFAPDLRTDLVSRVTGQRVKWVNGSLLQRSPLIVR
jgi:hypothetical protein